MHKYNACAAAGHNVSSQRQATEPVFAIMKTPAYVIDTGTINAIGNDTAQSRQSLRDGRSGIGTASILQTNWRDEIPVAEVKAGNAALAAQTGMPADVPRTALLSAIAVAEILQRFQGITRQYPVGFFSANTVGGMDLTEAFYKDFVQDKQSGDITSFVHHECGAVTNLVARHFGLTGFTTTISTACSSSANSIMMAAQMIRSGMIDIAIAGGADALCRFTLNGFNTLMILDRQPCQPFDQNRRGLNLGEGAGYLLLMSEKAMKACGATAIATVSGYANTNDAFHQTASSPDGTGNRLAMEGALSIAGRKPEDISYINLHGTGTANNDSSEGKAIESVFGNHIPAASSTKAFTGHTLGAAAGIEAVFSVLAIRDGIIYPNLRWQTQMEDLSFKPVIHFEQDLAIKHVMSNSFGFGGNCSSLIFSKC